MIACPMVGPITIRRIAREPESEEAAVAKKWRQAWQGSAIEYQVFVRRWVAGEGEKSTADDLGREMFEAAHELMHPSNL